jgi:hypothetical protein
MGKTVDVIIPVESEVAAALADARNREAVGRSSVACSGRAPVPAPSPRLSLN